MGSPLSIEVKKGKILAVWHGCLALPFKVYEVENDRATELEEMESIDYHTIDILDVRLKKEALEFSPRELTNDEISSREA